MDRSQLLQQLKDVNVLIESGGLNSKFALILKSHSDLITEIHKHTTFLHQPIMRERLYALIKGLTTTPWCLHCSLVPTRFNVNGKRRNQYDQYCSLKCSNNSTEVRNKKKLTTQANYGVDNPSKSIKVHNKKIATSQAKHGTDYPWQSQAIKDHKATEILQRYGVDNVAKLPEVKESIKATNIDRYGTPHPSQTDRVKEKAKRTSLKKYGALNFNQLHISVDTFDKLTDPTWMIDQHVRQQKPLVEIATDLAISDGTVGKYLHSHDILTHRHPVSQAEKEIVDFLTSHNVLNIKTNTRDVIRPLELDVYLPDYNVAIEYCGLYWHSHFHKDKNYHLHKYNECNKQGIRLLTIFEDEWIHNRLLVEQKLLSVLRKDPRPTVFARKCTICAVSTADKRTFLNNHHIQGDGPGSIVYGLRTQEGVLVAVMAFIKQADQHILNRYATSYRVIGGASKLLNHFKRHIVWNTLVSFADMRWSVGGLYDQTGWVLDKILPPDYTYVVRDTRVHKFNYRHKNLPNLLDTYDPTLSETDNTHANGIPRIYNCGLKRYVMHSPERIVHSAHDHNSGL